MKISATLITFNEEKNLPRALQSLEGCCDEIIVVDSGSRDRTCEIARVYQAQVYVREFAGYAEQKNYAASLASFDWILSLDADEMLSEQLREEIQALRQRGPDYDAYSMPRLTCYLGKWIRHGGWYPDRKVRLYDRRKGRWVGNYVHERVEVEGRVGQLRGDLLHYTCHTISDHLQRLDRYTMLAAQELIDRGGSASLLKLVFAPPWEFFRTYIFRAGFLDGEAGLTIARMAALYTFLKYLRARKWIREAGG